MAGFDRTWPAPAGSEQLHLEGGLACLSQAVRPGIALEWAQLGFGTGEMVVEARDAGLSLLRAAELGLG